MKLLTTAFLRRSTLSILIAASACVNEGAEKPVDAAPGAETKKDTNETDDDSVQEPQKKSYPFLKAFSEDKQVEAEKKTYFLQFENPDVKGACYLLPNPDGTVAEQALCEGDDEEIVATLGKYGFCGNTTVTSEESAGEDLRNAIPCETASEIRVQLEKNLRFGHDGLHLYHEDLVQACAQASCKSNPLAAKICEDTAELQKKIARNEEVAQTAALYDDAELDAVGACAAAAYGVKGE